MWITPLSFSTSFTSWLPCSIWYWSTSYTLHDHLHFYLRIREGFKNPDHGKIPLREYPHPPGPLTYHDFPKKLAEISQRKRAFFSFFLSFSVSFLVEKGVPPLTEFFSDGFFWTLPLDLDKSAKEIFKCRKRSSFNPWGSHLSQCPAPA